MTDKELLELAAKAAGIVGKWEQQPDHIQEHWYFNVPYDNQGMLTGFEWNPLTDDGDALRLAVRLRMCVEPWGAGASATVCVNNRALVAEPHYGDDPERATRRAIVRAAAEIGKAMP